MPINFRKHSPRERYVISVIGATIIAISAKILFELKQIIIKMRLHQIIIPPSAPPKEEK